MAIDIAGCADEISRISRLELTMRSEDLEKIPRRTEPHGEGQEQRIERRSGAPLRDHNNDRGNPGRCRDEQPRWQG